MNRAVAAVTLVALAAAGFVSADSFAAGEVRLVRRLRPASAPRAVDRRPRPPSIDAPSSPPVSATPTSSAPTSSAATSSAATSARGAVAADDPPPWRESAASASRVAGTGGAEIRATAAWRVLCAPPSSYAPSRTYFERTAELCAAHVRSALAAERPLGTPPWADVAFQCAGATSGILAVAGRQFWPPASPEASAEWYARTFGTAVDDASKARVARDLETFERAHAASTRQALDRLVHAATTRGDATRAAYFAQSGRVWLFAGDRFPDLDACCRSATAADELAASRAREIGR